MDQASDKGGAVTIAHLAATIECGRSRPSPQGPCHKLAVQEASRLQQQEVGGNNGRLREIEERIASEQVATVE